MKRDFQNPTEETYIKVFQKRVAVSEQKSNAEKIPFCRPCSWGEFYKQISMAETQARLDGYSLRLDDPKYMEIAKGIDLEKFYGFHKFTLLQTAEANNYMVVDGKKTVVPIGHNFNFQCKSSAERNAVQHMNTIFVPRGEYENYLLLLKGKNKKTDEVKKE